MYEDSGVAVQTLLLFSSCCLSFSLAYCLPAFYYLSILSALLSGNFLEYLRRVPSRICSQSELPVLHIQPISHPLSSLIQVSVVPFLRTRSSESHPGTQILTIISFPSVFYVLSFVIVGLIH